MPPSNLTQSLPSRGSQDDEYSPLNEQAPVAFNSTTSLNLPSNVQGLEPTRPTVTSDILQPSSPRFDSPRLRPYGDAVADGLGRRAPQPSPSANKSPQSQSARSAPTPRNSRLEVVLKCSSFKKLSDHQMYDEANLEGDELMTTKLTPKYPQRAPKLSSASRHAIPATKTSMPSAIKRPRGRPKGWRPGMPSTKTGLLTASATKYLDADGNRITVTKSIAAPKNTGQKRRGRPPRPPSPTARNIWEAMAPPKYIPFQCEWDHCPAELQNYKTLQKHIQVVHGKSAPLTCRWGRCGKTNPPPTFAQNSEFHDHVDTVHLIPYVWHCGEGQSNNRCVFTKTREQGEGEIPSYLLGPDGGQVTPSVRGQVVEDALTYRENRRRLRRILFQRDANAPSEEEDEAEEELTSS